MIDEVSLTAGNNITTGYKSKQITAIISIFFCRHEVNNILVFAAARDSDISETLYLQF